MADRRDRACAGCGLRLPHRPDAPAHPYIGASAECWALYGELLAREYQHPDYFRVHQLSVDTYAVQHPGRPERRTIQSVGLHLTTLCLFVEGGADPSRGPLLHKRLAGRTDLHWLEPPIPNGRLTVADVLPAPDANEHERAVRAWARDVWDAWSAHHQTVRGWIEGGLG